MAIVTYRPAEIDQQALNIRKIGDILANRATAD